MIAGPDELLKGAHRSGNHDPVAGENEGALGGVEHLDGAVEVGLIVIVAAALGWKFWLTRFPVEFSGSLLRVFGDVNEDGARTSAIGDQEGLANGARYVLRFGDHHVVLGDGHGDARDINLLKRVGAQDCAADLACDADDRRRGNQQGVLGHDPARKARDGWFPSSETLPNVRCAEFDIQLPVGNIEYNHVSLCDSGNRSTVGSFGRDVSSHESMGRAGKPAVGEQSDGIAETGAHQSGGDSQHFTHTRSASRALITDDDYIPRLDDVPFDGCKSCFLVVKHARGAAEILQVMTGDFYDAAFGSEISLEDNESACGLERRIELAHNLLRRRFLCRGCFFRQGTSGT